MIEKRESKSKIIKTRVSESLLDFLQREAKFRQMSLSGYINFVLNSSIRKHDILFDEKANKFEKKETRIRVSLTASETELLEQHALLNDWSLTKEVRYRVISSLSKKPKLNQKELQAISAVRSSINVLGANINRLVREGESLSDTNIEICQELIVLMKELRDKIDYLKKCTQSNFRLKEVGGDHGCSN